MLLTILYIILLKMSCKFSPLSMHCPQDNNIVKIIEVMVY